MHASSLSMMDKLLKEYLPADKPLRILDVGAFDTGNGNYRNLMSPSWQYIGCDIVSGPNVDFVQLSAYHIQEAPNDYDVVISGQCLEHIEEPWRIVPEMARVLKPGGLLIVAAPWTWPIHRFPVDCWRILPDGMAVLLRNARLIQKCEPFVNVSDCWGVAYKKGRTKIAAVTTAFIPNLNDVRMKLLRRSVSTLAWSGADKNIIITSGTDVGQIDNIASYYVGQNLGHVAGEITLIRAAAQYAIENGCEWVVRIPGDCLCNSNRWSESWYHAAHYKKAALLGSTDGFAQTKVISADAQFLLDTFIPNICQTNPEYPTVEHSWIPIIRARFGIDSIQLIPWHWINDRGYLYITPDDSQLSFTHSHTIDSDASSRPTAHSIRGCRYPDRIPR